MLKKITTLFYTLIVFTGCVLDNEFEVPMINTEENETLNEILKAVSEGSLELQTINQVKNLYKSGEEPMQIVSDVVIKGYVVSSDKEGNFFKEFYIQDTPENPTTGIRVVLNLTNSYNKYNIGREIYIRMKDLYIGETNSKDGIITVGGSIKTDNPLEIEAITTNQIEEYIFRSENSSPIIPKTVLSNAITKNDIGTFIAIENATFQEKDIGKPYVNPADDFDTQRELFVCQGLGYFSIPIESSSFSLFANESLPSGGGTINGVVTKNFTGDIFVLALNTNDDLFLNDTRCEPIDTTDFKILLKEDFEETSGDIDIENWTNYIEVGTRNWDAYEDEDSLGISADIGSFFSRNENTIGSFSDASELEVLISTNWNGSEETINSATWLTLPAKIVDDATSFEIWVHSGYIELSEYSGVAHIAFKYTGSGDENSDGTYELDNIMIQGK